MNILHIGKFYPPYKGGMETVLKDLAQGLSTKEQSTRVICSSESKNFQHIQKVNLEVFKYPTLKVVASQPICPSLLLNLKKHLKWADIIHMHSPNPILEVALIILARNKKIVCTHHSDIHRQKLMKFFYMPIWNIFKSQVKRFIIPTRNHILYSDMIDDVEKKSDIIPFGIDKNFSHSKSNIKLPFNDYFIFVGRLVEYKGLEHLIKAMRNNKENLVIIGRGPLHSNLIDLIKSLEIEERVKILQNVDSAEELNSYYAGAKCFILPSISKNENFGIVQLEAMAHKLPLIVTNIKSGVPTVSRPGITSILIEPKSVSELENAITQISKDPNSSKAMGEKGYELFCKQYTYDNMINQHIESYSRVLNG